jgi:hypothetical protein
VFIALCISAMALICASGIAFHLGLRLEQNEFAANLGNTNHPQGSASSQLLTSDFQELCKWLQHDTPIDHPSLDAFGRALIARRITDRIKPRLDKSPTIALVGELGAGKTSIYNLVLYELNSAKLLGQTIAVVRVSLWPFDTVDAAIRGILTALTEELGRHISITPIAGLPDEYISTIENAGLNWARLFKSNRPPSAILSDFDTVAAALDLHIVLWIEDLERFAGSTISGQPPEVERLGPIRSLLHLLSDIPSIQIVFATTLLSARFDIEKIARTVEPVHTLDEQTIRPILKLFMQGCLEPQDYIDPATPKSRKTLRTALEDDWTSALQWSIAGSISLPRALAIICNNPRRLKYGLRHCLDVWTRLRGEIDFDDVIVISLLRAAEPDVFSLIVDFVNELRIEYTPGRSWNRNSDTTERSQFATKLDEVLGSHPSLRRTAIEEILDFVFPNWANPGQVQVSKVKPQGLAVKSHRDYWERYLASSSLNEEEKDQPILHTIAHWKSKASDQLVTLMVNGQKLDAIEAFIDSALDDTELVNLLGAIVRAEQRRTPVNWRGRQPESMIAVWRQLFKRGQPAQLVGVLRDLLTLVTPVNLSLAHSLVQFFLVHDSSDVPKLIPTVEANSLRLHFTSLLEKSFAPDGTARLADALKDADPHILLRSSWGIHRVQQGDFNGEPFENWNTFKAVLLSAAEKFPETILTQLAPFVTRRREQFILTADGYRPVTTFSFDEELAERLFGRALLLDLFAKKGNPGLVNEDFRPVYSAVYDAAINPIAASAGSSEESNK